MMDIKPCFYCGTVLEINGWNRHDVPDTWACGNVNCFMFDHPIYDVDEYNCLCRKIYAGESVLELIEKLPQVALDTGKRPTWIQKLAGEPRVEKVFNAGMEVMRDWVIKHIKDAIGMNNE